MAPRWNTIEDRLLGQLYGERLPVEQIAARLGRTPDAVVARRHALGIAARQRSRPWSTDEVTLLRAATAAGFPASFLSRQLGRSREQVRAQRRALVSPKARARPYLTQEDEAIRRCLLEGGDLAVLAGRLGRSPDAVRLHAHQLGFHRRPARPRWTEWEDAVIREGYTSAQPCIEIARQLPHRSLGSVTARARRLGLATYARRWSAQDDQRLTRLTAEGTSLESLAQRLGRTPEALRRRAARLGTRPPAPAPAPRQARRWSEQEDELLRLHHALNPARLGQLLGRSDRAVCRRIRSLGLRDRAQRSPHHPVGRVDARPVGLTATFRLLGRGPGADRRGRRIRRAAALHEDPRTKHGGHPGPP